MQTGNLPAGSVLAPLATVTIDGTDRDTMAFSVSRELSTDDGGELVGGGYGVAATGSVTFAQLDTVTPVPPSPWSRRDGWPPIPGAPVSATVTLGGDAWPVFTGRVDTVSGSFGDGPVAASLVDDIDALRKLVTIEPGPARSALDCAFGVIADVLAQAGYSSHRAPTANTVLTMPLSAGRVRADGPGVVRDVLGNDPLYATAAPWGSGVSANTIHGIDFSMTAPGRTIDVWADVAQYGAFNLTTPGHTDGSSTAFLKLTTAYKGPLTIVWGHGSTTTTATVALPASGWGRVLFRRRVNADLSSWAGVWVVDALNPDPGPVAPAWSATLPAAPQLSPSNLSTTNAYSGLWHLAPDTGGIAGVTVDNYANTGTYATQVMPPAPNLIIEATAPEDMGPLSWVPSVAGRVASEVVKEIAAALLASVWLDETGTLRVVGRKALASRAVVRTVTATGDLLALGWADDLTNVRHLSRVESLAPAAQGLGDGAHSRARALWVAPHVTLAPGQSYEEIFHPEDGTEWVGVNTTITPDSAATIYNDTISATILGKGGSSQTLNATITELDPRSFKLRLSAPSTNTASVSNLIRDDYPDTSLRGMPSPLVRGDYFVTWKETKTDGAPLGPAYAADLVHPGGAWLQTTASVDAPKVLADTLAAAVSHPSPRVDSLDVVPDPRIQLGDRVRVVDDLHDGITLDAIVGGAALDVSGGIMRQTLRLRVLGVVVPIVTFKDFDTVWAGGTFADVDATWKTGTFADFDAAPRTRTASASTAPATLGDADARRAVGATLADADTARAGLTLAATDTDTTKK